MIFNSCILKLKIVNKVNRKAKKPHNKKPK
jgi:hypothetical protein